MIYMLSIIFSLTSVAQVSDKEIADLVLKSFPSVQMAKEDVRIAEGELQFANGAFDISIQGEFTQLTGNYEYEYLQSRIVKPTAIFGLDIYGGFRKGTGSIPIYDGQLETLSDGEWSIGAKLPLLRGFWIDERRALFQRNKILVDQRKFQLRATELSQLKEALHSYWDWRLSVQKMNIFKELLTIAETRDEWLLKRAKAGDIARFEREDNRRSILQRQSAYMQAEQGFRVALAELEYYVDDPLVRQRLSNIEHGQAALVLPQNISHYQQHTETLVELAYKNRPDLKSLSLQKGQFEIDSKLQSNRFLPKLDFEVEQSRDNGVGSNTLGQDNTKMSLKFEVPLQYRRISGRQEQIEGSISRVEQQKRLLQQRIYADIIAVQKSLQVAIKRRELAQEELGLAKKLEAGERLRLRQGETNILMVNLREQATAEAQLRYAETSAEALKHYVSLKIAVGELPTEG
jgi:outer membrane protein, heavy metal efflux system